MWIASFREVLVASGAVAITLAIRVAALERARLRTVSHRWFRVVPPLVGLMLTLYAGWLFLDTSVPSDGQRTIAAFLMGGGGFFCLAAMLVSRQLLDRINTEVVMLESRVEQRTRELTRANADLAATLEEH